MRLATIALATLALTIALAIAPGCETGSLGDDVAQLRGAVALANDDLDRLRSDLATAEAEGADPEVIADLSEKIDQGAGILSKLERSLAVGERMLADGEIGADDIGEGAGMIAGALGSPYAPLIPTLVTFGWGIFERLMRKRTERNSGEVVHSVDVALDTLEPEDRAKFLSTLKANQPTEGARALVKKAQGKRS